MTPFHLGTNQFIFSKSNVKSKSMVLLFTACKTVSNISIGDGDVFHTIEIKSWAI